MSANKVRSLTLTSKGQVTISARARKLLKLDQGDTLIEVVVGNCLVLMPENQILAQTARKAQEALAKAGISVDELQKEAIRLREEHVAAQFGSAVSATKVKPIWEQIEEMTSALPEGAFDAVPVDGASNHDKYLYGSAK